MKIIAATYHRNGVAGAGFNVAIIKDPLPDMKGKFLYIDFGDKSDHSDGCYDIENAVAVLKISDIIDENLNNKWRGDVIHDRVSEAVQDAVHASYDMEQQPCPPNF